MPEFVCFILGVSSRGRNLDCVRELTSEDGDRSWGKEEAEGAP